MHQELLLIGVMLRLGLLSIAGAPCVRPLRQAGGREPNPIDRKVRVPVH